MLDGFSPSVGRHTKVAITLNINVVDSTNDSEETIFTPMSSPRVTNTPILDTVFLTPSNDTDSVVFFNTSSCIVVNTICISFKVSGISD
jgi:hypothetical protein